jgi:hypothetical protein
MRAALALLVVTACGAFVEPAPATPAAPVAPPPPAVVVPPPVVVNNTFVTEVNESPAAEPPPPVPPPPPPVPRVAAVHPVPVPFCQCWATATMPPERAQRPSTTIASCDRYLDAAELSARCSAMEGRPLERMIESLDLTRRNFKRSAAMLGSNRDMVVESCDLAARQITESLAETCGG